MKKNQSGVSLIALVITIIVVIILAAVAFGTSTDTIVNANFSNFTNNIAEVQQSFDTVATTIKGTEAKNGTTRTDAQVYNYVAKGATTLDNSGEATNAWLSRSQADALPCTEISGDIAEKIFDRALPEMKVNTNQAAGVKVTYFVTNTGKVFVWPPYEYEGKYYVTDTETVKDTTGKEYTTDQAATVSGTPTFTVDGVKITVAGTVTSITTGAAAADLKDAASIGYTDARTPNSPVGRENATLYNSGAVVVTP